jgi:hypothetical protein
MNIWVEKERLWRKFVEDILSRLLKFTYLIYEFGFLDEVGGHVHVVCQTENIQLDF